MKIRLMTVCKNEERIMPFFIKHYESWVDELIIVDGGSTDRGLEIATELGNGKVKIKRAPYDDGKYVDDDILKRIRNEEWREGKENFDWIIVCDNDELLYHPHILDKLGEYKQKGITFPRVEGYQMMSQTFPDPSHKITDQVKRGYPDNSYNKHIIFDPNKISNPNYLWGSHISYPDGHVVYSEHTELKLLHYRMLSYEYHMNKAKIAYDNLARHTELCRKYNFGHHNGEILEKCTRESFDREFERTAQVVV